MFNCRYHGYIWLQSLWSQWTKVIMVTIHYHHRGYSELNYHYYNYSWLLSPWLHKTVPAVAVVTADCSYHSYNRLLLLKLQLTAVTMVMALTEMKTVKGSFHWFSSSAWCFLAAAALQLDRCIMGDWGSTWKTDEGLQEFTEEGPPAEEDNVSDSFYRNTRAANCLTLCRRWCHSMMVWDPQGLQSDWLTKGTHLFMSDCF